MKKKPPQTLQIRNSTAKFLIITSQAGENSIEVRIEGETVMRVATEQDMQGRKYNRAGVAG